MSSLDVVTSAIPIQVKELRGVTDFVFALRQCSCSRDLRLGKEVHSRAIQTGLISDVYVANSLIRMYGKCGDLAGARDVFDKMQRHNSVSWNVLVRCYEENGEEELALEIFDLVEESSDPNAFDYVTALAACASLACKKGEKSKWLQKVKTIHSLAAMSSLEPNNFVLNSLLDAYSKCGNMTYAQQVFDTIERNGRSEVPCNALMNGYIKNGRPKLALTIFDSMQDELGCSPNSRSYAAAFQACAALASSGKSKLWLLEKAKSAHSQAWSYGFSSDMFLANTLIDMYGKIGSIDHARAVFDSIEQPDSVSWTTLIQGYVDNGEFLLALKLFEELHNGGGGAIDNLAYVAAISACAALAVKSPRSCCTWIETGKQIHSRAVMEQQELVLYVKTSLIDMYGKCRNMLHAQAVFETINNAGLVPWTSLAQGYAKNEQPELALQLIARMDLTGIEASSKTLICGLQACGTLMLIRAGEFFHAEIQSRSLDQDVALVHCLVDFYGKCGRMEIARQVFNSIRVKTIASWNILIAAYAQQGEIDQVFLSFEFMTEEHGTRPDGVTFVHLISACAHAGLVAKGKKYFDLMLLKYGIKPVIFHYNCMVDLLSRANYLDEALAFIRSMPFQPCKVMWTSLLSSCCRWNNVGIGEAAYGELIKLDPHQTSAYVLMANIYLVAGMWDKRESVLRLQRKTDDDEKKFMLADSCD